VGACSAATFQKLADGANRIFQAAATNLKFRLNEFFDSPSGRLIHLVGSSTAL
jgi:hypothetical protein